MNWFVLYIHMLQATLGSFSGLASMSILREDFVVQNHYLTDRQLNTALVIGRSTPGPVGLYVVSVGYYAGGYPGAFAGWLALVTPALLVIPMIQYAGRKAESPAVKRMLRAVVLASAGVSLAATLPLGVDALHSPIAYGIAAVSLGLLLFTKVETIWVILGSAAAGLIPAAMQRI